ncbi:MAG: PIN domain-containing protein [Pseudanabaena sp. CAN_BIN31]|nr:PIN domain-containing protein [Pseudanabaena sp. CAN_BIN31]
MESITAIADTGFIVALTNIKDIHHQNVKAVYVNQRKILLPQTVLAEVAYLLAREAGISLVVKFLRSLMASRFELVSLIEEDITTIANILDQYQSSRIDFVDASVMAVAERYDLTTILTIDRRDFSLYRPKHCAAFTILP